MFVQRLSAKISLLFLSILPCQEKQISLMKLVEHTFQYLQYLCILAIATLSKIESNTNYAKRNATNDKIWEENRMIHNFHVEQHNKTIYGFKLFLLRFIQGLYPCISLCGWWCFAAYKTLCTWSSIYFKAIDKLHQ